MKLFFAIVIVFSSILYSQNWVWQNPLPQGKSLKNIFAVNESIAFAVGDNGTVLKTLDEGENWLILSSGVSTKLNSCFFVTENIGYIAGDDGKILKTTNGGSSFTQLDSKSSADIHTLFFFNELSGYAAGSNGTILFTSDGGINWVQRENDDKKAISDIFFISDSNGWYVGEEGIIKATVDGGANWTNQNSNTNNILSSVFFISQSVGWVCGTNGTLLKTTDGGNTWQPQYTGVSNWLRSLIFIDQDNGIIVGEPGIILTTTDGGSSWMKNEQPRLFELYSVSSFNNKLFVVGKSGIIISSSDMGLNWEFRSGWDIEINDILFKNENEGIAVGNDGFIITTSDGGNNWVKRESGITKNLNAIGFNKRKPDQYWVVGDSATVLFSSDNGITWSVDFLILLVTENDFYGVVVKSGFIKIATTNGKYVEKRFSGDTNWQQRGNFSISEDFFDIYADTWKSDFGLINRTLLVGQDGVFCNFDQESFSLDTGHVQGADDLYDIFFWENNLYGWVVGKYGIVARTDYVIANGIWSVIAQMDVNALYSVIFISPLIGYTAGTNGSLYKTANNGYAWYKINTGVTNLLQKVFFINENTGWIAGVNGIILRTANDGHLITSNEDRISSLPDKYFLSQNYPNPFNPSTTISFHLPETGFVSLKIYDLLGNEVKTLINEERHVGEYSVKFDGSNLSSGVYFYRLASGNFSETKKLLLLK